MLPGFLLSHCLHNEAISEQKQTVERPAGLEQWFLWLHSTRMRCVWLFQAPHSAQIMTLPFRIIASLLFSSCLQPHRSIISCSIAYTWHHWPGEGGGMGWGGVGVLTGFRASPKLPLAHWANYARWPVQHWLHCNCILFWIILWIIPG